MNMSVFTERNSVWQGSNHLCGGASLQLQPGGIAFGQGIPPHLQFIGISEHGSASQRHRLTNERNVHPVITVFNNFIQKGGDSGKNA
jgi:hypothetical protein